MNPNKNTSKFEPNTLEVFLQILPPCRKYQNPRCERSKMSCLEVFQYAYNIHITRFGQVSRSPISAIKKTGCLLLAAKADEMVALLGCLELNDADNTFNYQLT